MSFDKNIMHKNMPKHNPKISNGMRLNKYLAHQGISTRRGADALIAAGKIFINGKRAAIGAQVGESDKVTVAGVPDTDHVYYAYYKPVGVITVGREPDTKSIADVARFPTKVFPVGRLDKDSEGLIIMTNDGRVSERLLHPDREHEKEYVVTVDKDITHEFLVKMFRGVKIKSGKTKESKIRRKDKHTFEIVLSEGKNRQIRRMCGTLGYQVKKLKRIRVMDIILGRLKANQWRAIEGKDLAAFKKSLGI